MFSNCDFAIRQNHFADVALFLAGGDRIGYFVDRSRIFLKIGSLQFNLMQNGLESSLILTAETEKL